MMKQKLTSFFINVGRYIPLLPVLLLVLVGSLIVVVKAFGIASQDVGELIGIVGMVILQLFVFIASFIILDSFDSKGVISEKKSGYLLGSFLGMAAGNVLFIISLTLTVTGYSSGVLDVQIRSLTVQELIDWWGLILGLAYVSFGALLIDCRRGYTKGITIIALVYIGLAVLYLFGWFASLQEEDELLGYGTLIVLGFVNLGMYFAILYLVGKYLFLQGCAVNNGCSYLTRNIKFFSSLNVLVFASICYVISSFLEEPWLKNISLFLFLLGYFLPTFLVLKYKVKNGTLIIFINVLLGWSVVGWLVSFFMVFILMNKYGQCPSCMGYVYKTAEKCMHCGERS